MGKIKHTKNELRAQREALRRFERFLPMLQLKQKQLKAEVRRLDQEIAAQEAALSDRLGALEPWVSLFSELPQDTELVSSPEVIADTANIAGVVIPVLREVVTRRAPLDLFATPPWFDDAQEFLQDMQRLHAGLDLLRESRRLLAEELRTTTQRVNLFEKVKIPESRENIRIIRIFLGDEQTAAVARAKAAKRRHPAETPVGEIPEPDPEEVTP